MAGKRTAQIGTTYQYCGKKQGKEGIKMRKNHHHYFLKYYNISGKLWYAGDII
jgi:hypothetical protein